MIEVKEITIYPIKSIAGVSVKKAYAGERGFESDRRWMLIDADNHFITQRQHHHLSLVNLQLNDESILLSQRDSSFGNVAIPLKTQSGSTVKAQIWDDVVDVLWPGLEADTWFSDYLQQSVRLVYMPEASLRRVDPDYVPETVHTGLNDGFPYLLTNTASLRDVNGRCGESLEMKRFRPNVVVESTIPFEEDNWKLIAGKEVIFQPVKPCGRCVITTVDPETGVAGKEPLQTLSTFRKKGNKILFGQNMIARRYGWLEVGEILEVSH